jgi:hypothetical protein
VRTIHIETNLPTDADRVWQAMQHPASFSYVCRGVIGLPALAGRTEPMHEGELGTAWLLLFHVIPLSHHTIHLVKVDPANRTMQSREHGGMLRQWNHTLHVEPISPRTCRYRDTVEIDAGPLTPIVARASIWIYRYRQRRWHKLVRKHLLPTGPQYGRPLAKAAAPGRRGSSAVNSKR